MQKILINGTIATAEDIALFIKRVNKKDFIKNIINKNNVVYIYTY